MLKQEILEDLKSAMKAGDTVTRDTLRMLDSMIKNEEISAGKREEGLDDAAIMTLVKRAIKQRKDAAAQYRAADRPELALNEETEYAVIEKYLPAQMSEEELRTVLEKVVADSGASGPADMGKVMGGAMQAVGDGADGGSVKKIIQEILTK